MPSAVLQTDCSLLSLVRRRLAGKPLISMNPLLRRPRIELALAQANIDLDRANNIPLPMIKVEIGLMSILPYMRDVCIT